MSTALLATKLFVPPLRPELVSRPRLLGQLNAGLQRKLTLVSAPAGFGKTTLLGEWAAVCQRRKPKVRVGWLTLDDGDNDPARFLAYLVGALQTIKPGVGADVLTAFQAPQLPPIEASLTTLLNDIAAMPGPFVLILDDYHLITAQPIHDALTFLLDHLPPQMHLSIATRADPPLHIPRWRMAGQLTELRINDLRFANDEAATFFNCVMGLDLSAQDISALEARAEGWIAGLQAAALSLQGRDAGRTASFVQAFTGSHRFVLDYLVEEVFQRQPEQIQSFLLQTAILDRLTGPLCDAVCLGSAETPGVPEQGAISPGAVTSLPGVGSGQEILEQLERANLFIIPLDDERRWYRYHRLFADLLRARLHARQSHQVVELHRRAAGWYERNGLLTQAVGHALAARDFAEAARLVERIASVTLWERGEVTTFVGWLEALPGGQVRSRPRLGLYYAWALLIAARLDGVEEHLRDVEEALGQAKPPLPSAERKAPGTGATVPALSEAEIQDMLREIAVMRAMIANFQGDEQRTIELCHQALDGIAEDNLFLRGTIAGNLGGAYAKTGDVVAASHAFAEASCLGQASGNAFAALIALNYLAGMQVIRGRLQEAAQTYRQALELAAERHLRQLPLAGMAHVGLGALLYEWNDQSGAEHHLREGIELAERPGGVLVGPGLHILVDGYLALARVRQMRDDVEGAQEMLRKAERCVHRHHPSTSSGRVPPELSQVAAARARLAVAQGDLGAAVRWAQECGLSADDEPSYPREFAHLTLARVHIAQEQLDSALTLLGRLLPVVEAAGRMGRAAETLALQALAFHAQGAEHQAVTVLERALTLAGPEDYIRLFLDEGAPMEELLRRALSLGIAPDYVVRLLANLDKVARALPSVAQPLIEPLSPRELEVLQRVANGLSNREIADELYIAVTTVKKHISNIHGKLGVKSRTQAIARARELGLL